MMSDIPVVTCTVFKLWSQGGSLYFWNHCPRDLTFDARASNWESHSAFTNGFSSSNVALFLMKERPVG